MIRNFRLALIALAGLTLLPAVASAQSAIAGTVKDTSGAVMPGVTVEAASPALIEKVRSVTTDERGLYQIVNLVPGTYTVTFTLPGFSTVKREGLELPGNFTATVNADLKVGALEETVNVTGASPVVDVQSTAKSQVINREVLDSVPTGKTAQTAAALVTGVIMATPDVAGSGAQNQNATTAHGMNSAQTTVLLDGIQMNGMCGNGATQSYTSTQNYEEIVVQNSGAGADVEGGGVRQYLIPRKGGNEFHGTGSAVYATHNWQAEAITPELAARGLTKGDSFDNLYTYEAGFGGKFIKDKLWWFGNLRHQQNNVAIADTFYKDGSQGISDQYIQNVGLRVTYQLDQKNQLNVYTDRVFKYLGHDMAAGYDPEKAAMLTLRSPLYQQVQAKWTSTLSSKLLLEVGFNQYQAYRTNTYQPGVEQPYATPAWEAGATRRDLSTGSVNTAYPITLSIQDPTRRYFNLATSYVTGTHNIKFGVQDNWGYEWFATYKNADLEQNYQNGTPTSVYVFNTPTYLNNAVDGSWGIYGQDAWTLKRLTLNYGLRWSYFKSSIPEESAGKGKFTAGTRSYGPETFPIWKDFSPRFGVIYDVFGNAKTAVKFAANKYQLQLTDTYTNGYNPIRLQSATLNWTDLNRDDVAQGSLGCIYQTPGCEINFSQLPNNFAAVTPGCSALYSPGAIPCGTTQLAADRKRDYSWQYNIGVQHELMPRVSVSANWFRTNLRNLGLTYNVLQSFSDYTPVTVYSPIDGHPVTVYNVSAAANVRVLNVQANASENRKEWNNALEFAVNARLPRGVSVFGGVSTDHSLNIRCDDPANPNNQLYCDQTQNGIPWLTQSKMALSMPLAYGLRFGAGWQFYKRFLPAVSGVQGTNWLVTRTTRYAADCKGDCTPGALVIPNLTVAQLNVPLEAPGVLKSDWINQLDINVGKNVKFGKLTIEPEVSVFNTLNSLAVYAVRSFNYGTSSYLQPSTTLIPRVMRIGADVKW